MKHNIKGMKQGKYTLKEFVKSIKLSNGFFSIKYFNDKTFIMIDYNIIFRPNYTKTSNHTFLKVTIQPQQFF